MKESTVIDQPVVAEKPKKIKEGTKADASAGETKVAKPRVVADTKFRILNGVDAANFRGQRQIVVRAAQSLGEGFHSVADIATKCEGLVSKTPVEKSALYHLKGLVEDSKAESHTPVAAPAAPAATEEKKAA